jgi:MoaA/NifB/PqqE/SkfB family radical SAM enzyme
MPMREWLTKLWIIPGLWHGEKAFCGPYYINIDVTHRCNMRCAYCRWHSPLVSDQFLDAAAQKDIDAALFEGLCQDLESLGSHKVVFCGAGEPALHPHFLQLVASAKRHRLWVTTYTNGTLFRRISSQDLIDSGLDLIRFSIADSSPERYAARHPYVKPGIFEAIWEGIRQLSSARRLQGQKQPQIELTIPVDRENMLLLDEMVELATATGINRLLFSVVLDFGQENLKPFTLKPQEVIEACQRLGLLRQRLERMHLGHNIDDVLLRYQAGRPVLESVPCYSAWYFSFVDTSGTVRVCQRATEGLGDLKTETFSQIWNGPAYRACRRQTLGRMDPGAVGRQVDCTYCPHLANNHQVDRFYRWFSFFSGTGKQHTREPSSG